MASSPIPKKVVLDFETAYNEDPTAPTPYIVLASENGITATQNSREDKVIAGDIDSGGQKINTDIEVAGNMKAPMYYEDAGVFLKSFMGEPETIAGDGTNGAEVGSYIHTFVSTKCIPSLVVQDTLSLECNKTSSTQSLIKRFNGVRANTLAVSATPDGEYEFDMNYVGARARDSINHGITELDENNKKDVGGHTRIKNEHLKLFIDDDTNFYKLAKEFAFTIDRGTTAVKTLTSGAFAEDVQFLLTGNLNSIFDGKFYKKAVKNKEMKTRLLFEQDNFKLEFTMEQTSFVFKDSPRSYGEQYQLDCEFSAYKTTAKEKLKVVLINKTPNY